MLLTELVAQQIRRAVGTLCATCRRGPISLIAFARLTRGWSVRASLNRLPNRAQWPCAP